MATWIVLVFFLGIGAGFLLGWDARDWRARIAELERQQRDLPTPPTGKEP